MKTIMILLLLSASVAAQTDCDGPYDDSVECTNSLPPALAQVHRQMAKAKRRRDEETAKLQKDMDRAEQDWQENQRQLDELNRRRAQELGGCNPNVPNYCQR